jgi:hypothetical protein
MGGDGRVDQIAAKPSKARQRSVLVGTRKPRIADDVGDLLPPFVRAILDEVIRPDVVGPLGAQTDTGSVRKPGATLLGLFGGDLQRLFPDYRNKCAAIGVER